MSNPTVHRQTAIKEIQTPSSVELSVSFSFYLGSIDKKSYNILHKIISLPSI